MSAENKMTTALWQALFLVAALIVGILAIVMGYGDVVLNFIFGG